jgi:plasmid stabilization system protein ParE
MLHEWWIKLLFVRSKLPNSLFQVKVPEYASDEIRELIEKPYRIIYRIKEDQIDVLSVIHGSRLFPDEL